MTKMQIAVVHVLLFETEPQISALRPLRETEAWFHWFSTGKLVVQVASLTMYPQQL